MTSGAAVVVRCQQYILAISAGHDLHNWGLPGGKLERGESFQAAAVRELWEETGAWVDPGGLKPLVRGPTRSGGEHVIFLATGRVWLPPALESRPFEGHVDWKLPAELLEPQCTYAANNRLALSRAGLWTEAPRGR